jgi:hypothetical protein
MSGRIISERTRAGLASAKTRGRLGGRPTVMTPERMAIARRMRGEKETWEAIAAALQVGVSSVRCARADDAEAPLLQGAGPQRRRTSPPTAHGCCRGGSHMSFYPSIFGVSREAAYAYLRTCLESDSRLETDSKGARSTFRSRTSEIYVDDVWFSAVHLTNWV